MEPVSRRKVDPETAAQQQAAREWRRLYADTAVVTEADVADPVEAEISEYPSVLYPDAYDASVAAVEYWVEVQECCGGRDKTCGHARG